MIEQPAIPQNTAMSMHQNAHVSPLLYLSSADAGWEGLAVEAFHEPNELVDWMTTARPTVSLMLFSGGAMRVEQRHAQSHWKTFSFHHGDLVLRPNAAPLELRKKSLSHTPTRTLHLYLSKSLVARATEEVAGHDPSRLELVEHFGFQDPLLAQICQALWRELEQPAPAGKIYAQTAAQMLITHLLRHYTAGGDPIKEPKVRLTDQQVRRVMDFVQAHLDQDLSLETLAEQTGFSPYHFARLFRQATGTSPHQFVLHQRVERAQLLLKEREVPLAQVAAACGFTDQSHLTQVFKRYVGLTPRAFQRDRFM